MLKISTPARSLLLLGLISCLLLFVLPSRYDVLDGQSSRTLYGRQLFPGVGGDDKDTSTSATATSAETSQATSAAPTTTSQQQQPTQQSTSQPATSEQTSDAATPSQTSQDTTSSQASSQPPSSASSQPPTSAPSNDTPPPTPTPTPMTSESVSTGANGELETVTVVVTPSPISSESPTPTAKEDNGGENKGVGTSTIVGLSVAGGIAVICIAAFLIWKFTRKRFTDDFDDSEAIKWPELHSHGDNPHALPTNRTGGAGFETNSEVNLTRPSSRAGSVAPSAAASTVDLYVPGQDPYAVPPLPHLNPNQPYRDDPNATFYDPYNGPVPSTLGNAEGEAIPMTQIARTRSPGPQMAFDPVMGASRARSPGPQAAFDMAGRQSPAPSAYGFADPRARSPGPAMALGAGRISPGPQAALGYGNGRHSPGPQVAYGS